jgi:tetratricopeptide (TPR) repeat protein
MSSVLHNSGEFLKTVFRMLAVVLNSVTSHFVIREKAAEAQDWKRRKAETLWKEAVELQNMGEFTKSLVKWADSAKFESDSNNPRKDFLAHVYNVMGYCNYRLRNFSKSRDFYERALETYKKITIFKDANTAYTMNNYALLLLEMGEEKRAEEMIHDSLKILEKKVGSDSPLLAYILNNMARAYNRLEKYEESEKILIRALEIEGKMMVSESPEVVTTLELLAIAAYKLRAYKQAEPLFLQVVKQREEANGKDHPAVISALFALGNFYSDIGSYEVAEPIFKRCMDILASNYGVEHHFSGVFFNQLGWVAIKRGELDKAGEYFDHSVVIAENFSKQHRIELAVSLYNRGVLGCKKAELDLVGDKLIRAMVMFASAANREAYLPVAQYGLAVFLDMSGDSSLAAFFGKCSVQYSIDRREKGFSKPNLPRWLLYLPEDVPDFLTGLFGRLDRLVEAQAMHAKLNCQRKPVSNLHGKTTRYLQGLWELNQAEKVWDSQYKDWLEQARLWGEDVTRAEDSTEEDSEPLEKNSEYESLDELIAGFSVMLEHFKLETAVGGIHLAQPIDSPGVTGENLVTNKVTEISPVTPDK